MISSLSSFLVGREQLITLLSRRQEVSLLGFKNEGYLYDTGWIRSVTANEVADKDGKPLPWLTYPAISFLEKRLGKDMALFEFGCGNSTLYYAGKVALVYSVEHDKLWFDKISGTLPKNTCLFFCQLEPGGDYCHYAIQTGREFDIIVIDGRDRVNCCKNSIASLKPGGIVILDDAEREKYREGVSLLENEGFKKIEFWGIAPMINYLKCTIIFYREDNCLGI